MKYGFFPGCSYKSEAGYKESVNAINSARNIELSELADWNCCGATVMFSLNELDALALTGRLFALSNQQECDQIVTTCNACYATLRKAKRILENSPEAVIRINQKLSGQRLKIDKLVPVRHYLELLTHDVREENWKQTMPSHLTNIRVAAYYGCQFSRPWEDADHPERPTILDRFIQRLGFVSIDHSAKTLCCGASHFFPYESHCRTLVSRILNEARRKGAQIICTICPLCQFNLDAAQAKLDLDPIAVPYFTQLAGLALGYSPKELGMKKLLVSMNEMLGENYETRSA